MYKSILVPVDGSKLSYQALDAARKLCERLDAKLTVVTSSPTYPAVIVGEGYMLEPISPKDWNNSVKVRHNTISEQVTKKLKAFPHAFSSTIADQAYEGILLAAKKHKCDLIVMASHGRRGLSALLLGSETTKVLTHSKLPVLVVR